MAEAQSEKLYATGRRKTAVARVYIKPGSGKFVVNDHSAETYFERETSRMVMRQSLEVLEFGEKFDITARVTGGGHSAQAEAIRHGVARALAATSQDLRTTLKRAGFLTRDSRKKERKKYGQPGARKKFQYSKR